MSGSELTTQRGGGGERSTTARAEPQARVGTEPIERLFSAPTPVVAPQPPLTVWLLDEPVCPAYDQYVAGHPEGTFFHSLAWRDVLMQAGCGQPLYLMAQRGERVAGVLPLYEMHAPGGTQLLSLPHTPAAGALADDAATGRVLAERASQLAERRGGGRVYARQFSKPAPQRGAPAQSAWVRLPRPAVLGHPAGTWEACILARTETVPLTERHVAAFRATQPTALLDALLRLSSHGYRPLYTLIHDAGVESSAIWVAAGERVHVLALAARDASAGMCLLGHVLRHPRAARCRTIEFPATAVLAAELAAGPHGAWMQTSRQEVLSRQRLVGA